MNQQTQDPFQNYMNQFNQQNNNTKIVIQEQPQNIQVQQGNGGLSNLTAYQKVFKTTADGKVVCNFEDVKKYIESETRTEIIPKTNSGIKRIVEIEHKM
ncbi:unnamed protein product (macronuclear) [Paramecium tetraurelia]|uniref:Uncharacterized protein n=1 Tax=Paramecium tetraurelia TaxID=5888 RepID=A0CXF8_PARTE|nr:uncharacterized protein GSPATT00011107001 [Paramecium tetraurelia]CAK75475.1 unnamed protein product [Paramecium tetraurelia]|eukprot:XP_001442872.1 hypothetical protein (macronuclear) [Paramecium tetraurelia strain d4-2]